MPNPATSPSQSIAACYDVDCDGASECFFDLNRPQPLFHEANYSSVTYMDLLTFEARVVPSLTPTGCDNWKREGYISSNYGDLAAS
jgi:hypothetical protein